MHAKGTLKQYLTFLVGAFICAMGIGFISRAALGSSPLSSLPFVLYLSTKIHMGSFTFAANMLFLVLESALRRRIGWYQALQVAATIAFSYCIDFALTVIPTQLNGPLPMKLLYLVIGCLVMALGITLEVFGDVVILPGEGFVQALAEKTGWEFGNVKVGFDCTLTAIAAVISLFVFHRLNGVGVGTLVSALVVGQIINLYSHKLAPLRSWVRKK